MNNLFISRSIVISFLIFLSYIFKDSKVPINFENNNELLPIISGILVGELLIIIGFTILFPTYKTYVNWYKTFRLSSFIADFIPILLFFMLARYIIYKFNLKLNLFEFLILIIVIQVIHDYLFYLLFKFTPKNKNYMLDYFKKYANEVSYHAILGDSYLMCFCVLFTSLFMNFSNITNITISLISFYIAIYLIHLKR